MIESLDRLKPSIGVGVTSRCRETLTGDSIRCPAKPAFSSSLVATALCAKLNSGRSLDDGNCLRVVTATVGLTFFVLATVSPIGWIVCTTTAVPPI